MTDRRFRARRVIEQEMDCYRSARKSGDMTEAWRRLERAHIVSQPYLMMHLGNHWEMLGFAVALGDYREVGGQAARLALAPLGALTGRIPIGNTGRSNVSAFASLDIPDDLRIALDGTVS